MNNKIQTSAVFLAIVLVAGTIAAISPLLIKGVNAQGNPYYNGMDNRYDDRKSYDNNKRSYGNDYGYESQYQPSYKPDYKSQYPSYVKDNRDKSNKDSKSVDINKLNCINTNININGNNTGDINVGNKGADKGYLGAYSSSDGSGYGYEGYYNDGYNNNKQDKGFDCIINNNNNNTNVVAGGGNITDGGGNITEPQTCEECFRAFLTEDQIDIFLGSATLEMYCDAIESGNLDENEVRADLAGDASMADINAIIECLKNLGILPP